MKKIYIYDAKTGEYLFSESAEKSPLEKDVYLLPAFATFLEPPAATQYKTPVFKAGQWKLVPDYRQAKLFSTATGEEIKCELDSEPTEAVTTQPRPSSFHIWKSGGWKLDAESKKYFLKQKLSSVRRLREFGGITINNITVPTDRESQAMLMAAYILLKDGIQQIIDYKTENGFVQLDLQAITDISQAVSLHVQACFSREKQLLSVINGLNDEHLVNLNPYELWDSYAP